MYSIRVMSCYHISEKEAVPLALHEMRFCGEILEVETDEDGNNGKILFQPPEEYYALWKRLRAIERLEEQQDIFVI